ncbi:BRCA2-interacting transcriptional repressor EMSY-like isoform X2 [Limulus polyphemus]|uniref:BRCA2-interacting transcriptional repressor EMSY-like isoform X2 n=1 Tax=Limulus polyphemus TaxID=6850 RepID=A0ABM1SX09_LIMPO|nr:BRCA2-interacting transcriptional repressor EMSY-like isoform X2 [Limulus polyphemus]
MWPMLLDYTRDDCKRILRTLELEAYASIVSAFRAQGELTKEKKKMLHDLSSSLSISLERHRAEIRRAVNDERLNTIADRMAGPNTAAEWAIEGRRLIPLLPRLVPQTAFTAIANNAANIQAAKNAALMPPSATGKKETSSPPTSGMSSPLSTPSTPTHVVRSVQSGQKSSSPASTNNNVMVFPSGMPIHVKGEGNEEEVNIRKRKRSSSLDSAAGPQKIHLPSPVASASSGPSLGINPIGEPTLTSNTNITTQAVSRSVSLPMGLKVTFSSNIHKTTNTVSTAPSPKVILVSSSGTTVEPGTLHRPLTVPVVKTVAPSGTTGSLNKTKISVGAPVSVSSGGTNQNLPCTTTLVGCSSSGIISTTGGSVGTQNFHVLSTGSVLSSSSSVNTGWVRSRPRTTIQSIPKQQVRPRSMVMVPRGLQSPSPYNPTSTASQSSGTSFLSASGQSYQGVQVVHGVPVRLPAGVGRAQIQYKHDRGVKVLTPSSATFSGKTAGSSGSPQVVVVSSTVASAQAVTKISTGSYGAASGARVVHMASPNHPQGVRTVARPLSGTGNIGTRLLSTGPQRGIQAGALGRTQLSGAKPNVIVVHKAQVWPQSQGQGATIVVSSSPGGKIPAEAVQEAVTYIQRQERTRQPSMMTVVKTLTTPRASLVSSSTLAAEGVTHSSSSSLKSSAYASTSRLGESSKSQSLNVASVVEVPKTSTVSNVLEQKSSLLADVIEAAGILSNNSSSTTLMSVASSSNVPCRSSSQLTTTSAAVTVATYSDSIAHASSASIVVSVAKLPDSASRSSVTVPLGILPDSGSQSSSFTVPISIAATLSDSCSKASSSLPSVSIATLPDSGGLVSVASVPVSIATLPDSDSQPSSAPTSIPTYPDSGGQTSAAVHIPIEAFPDSVSQTSSATFPVSLTVLPDSGGLASSASIPVSVGVLPDSGSQDASVHVPMATLPDSGSQEKSASAKMPKVILPDSGSEAAVTAQTGVFPDGENQTSSISVVLPDSCSQRSSSSVTTSSLVLPDSAPNDPISKPTVVFPDSGGEASSSSSFTVSRPISVQPDSGSQTCATSVMMSDRVFPDSVSNSTPAAVTSLTSILPDSRNQLGISLLNRPAVTNIQAMSRRPKTSISRSGVIPPDSSKSTCSLAPNLPDSNNQVSSTQATNSSSVPVMPPGVNTVALSPVTLVSSSTLVPVASSFVSLTDSTSPSFVTSSGSGQQQNSKVAPSQIEEQECKADDEKQSNVGQISLEVVPSSSQSSLSKTLVVCKEESTGDANMEDISELQEISIPIDQFEEGQILEIEGPEAELLSQGHLSKQLLELLQQAGIQIQEDAEIITAETAPESSCISVESISAESVVPKISAGSSTIPKAVSMEVGDMEENPLSSSIVYVTTVADEAEETDGKAVTASAQLDPDTLRLVEDLLQNPGSLTNRLGISQADDINKPARGLTNPESSHRSPEVFTFQLPGQNRCEGDKVLTTNMDVKNQNSQALNTNVTVEPCGFNISLMKLEDFTSQQESLESNERLSQDCSNEIVRTKLSSVSSSQEGSREVTEK